MSRLPMLQCSQCDCGKWRRVDASTHRVYCNKEWWKDRLREEEATMLKANPAVAQATAEWLQAWDGSPVGTNGFEAFCASAAFLRAVHDSHGQALLMYFVRFCENNAVVVEDDLENRLSESWAALGGPRFRCSMLVDTSCAEPCDWRQMVDVAHSVADITPMSYESILIHDAGSESGGMQLAQFMRFSEVARPAATSTSSLCSVPGCGRPFPPHIGKTTKTVSVSCIRNARAPNGPHTTFATLATKGCSDSSVAKILLHYVLSRKCVYCMLRH